MYFQIFYYLNQLIVLALISECFLLCGYRTKKTSMSKTSLFKQTLKKTSKKVENDSLKSYPVFVMPTKGEQLKKMKLLEEEKKKKIEDGYYQEKSDQDDTLEKIESLRLEMSEKTRRATKKKNRKKL